MNISHRLGRFYNLYTRSCFTINNRFPHWNLFWSWTIITRIFISCRFPRSFLLLQGCRNFFNNLNKRFDVCFCLHFLILNWRQKFYFDLQGLMNLVETSEIDFQEKHLTIYYIASKPRIIGLRGSSRHKSHNHRTFLLSLTASLIVISVTPIQW